MDEPQKVKISEPVKLGFSIGFGFFLFNLLISIPLGTVFWMWLSAERSRAAFEASIGGY